MKGGITSIGRQFDYRDPVNWKGRGKGKQEENVVQPAEEIGWSARDDPSPDKLAEVDEKWKEYLKSVADDRFNIGDLVKRRFPESDDAVYEVYSKRHYTSGEPRPTEYSLRRPNDPSSQEIILYPASQLIPVGAQGKGDIQRESVTLPPPAPYPVYDL
tara:strand:- start:412 stop:885 length:474 start_codon:yes stop_codon:yes gene_type:complete